MTPEQAAELDAMALRRLTGHIQRTGERDPRILDAAAALKAQTSIVARARAALARFFHQLSGLA